MASDPDAARTLAHCARESWGDGWPTVLIDELCDAIMAQAEEIERLRDERNRLVGLCGYIASMTTDPGTDMDAIRKRAQKAWLP